MRRHRWRYSGMKEGETTRNDAHDCAPKLSARYGKQTNSEQCITHAQQASAVLLCHVVQPLASLLHTWPAHALARLHAQRRQDRAHDRTVRATQNEGNGAFRRTAETRLTVVVERVLFSARLPRLSLHCSNNTHPPPPRAKTARFPLNGRDVPLSLSMPPSGYSRPPMPRATIKFCILVLTPTSAVQLISLAARTALPFPIRDCSFSSTRFRLSGCCTHWIGRLLRLGVNL